MKKIILDCDPGHDDAIAILLAAKNEKIDLLGLTVVSGNQTLEKTSTNTLNVCQHLGIDVEVYGGSAEPLVREKQEIADNIHGVTGLDGPVFEELEREMNEKHAIDYIIETVLEQPEPITLVATGPLTNIALALKMNPAIKENIEEIVIMGGSYQLGNTTPAAEFNILVDPESAHIVFESGVPVVMVGLDVTRQVMVTKEVLDRIAKIDNKASKLFVDLMIFFNKTQKEVFGWDGGPLHDPLTIAYLIDPTVIETKLMNVQIDTWSHQSYGRTNCDFFNQTDLPKNSHVAVGIDIDKYWDIIEEAIQNYD